MGWSVKLGVQVESRSARTLTPADPARMPMPRYPAPNRDCLPFSRVLILEVTSMGVTLSVGSSWAGMPTRAMHENWPTRLEAKWAWLFPATTPGPVSVALNATRPSRSGVAPKKYYTLMLDEELIAALKEAKSRSTELSEASIIRQALREWFDRNGVAVKKKRTARPRKRAR